MEATHATMSRAILAAVEKGGLSGKQNAMRSIWTIIRKDGPPRKCVRSILVVTRIAAEAAA